MSEQVQHTQTTPTPQQAYALLQGTYGYLKAEAFADVLLDKRGHADLLACHLMEWLLDWYRPTKTGKARLHGPLFLPSSSLAALWMVSTRQLQAARKRISDAGLAKFQTVQHTCLVDVQWTAVGAALHAHAARVENFRPTEKRTSELSRPTEKRTSEASDLQKNVPILPLPTSSKPTPPTEEEEDAVQHTTSGSGCNTPPATLALARADGRTAHPADALMALMAEHGRTCSGTWAQEAREAWDALVDAGLDPSLIEEAVKRYLAESEARRSPSLAPLNRYLLGQWSCGDLAFERLYEQVQHTHEHQAEQERVAAGGTPTWRAQSIALGGISDDGGWIVTGGGVQYVMPDAMSRAEVIAEATRRWGATHPSHTKEA